MILFFLYTFITLNTQWNVGSFYWKFSKLKISSITHYWNCSIPFNEISIKSDVFINLFTRKLLKMQHLKILKTSTFWQFSLISNYWMFSMKSFTEMVAESFSTWKLSEISLSFSIIILVCSFICGGRRFRRRGRRKI